MMLRHHAQYRDGWHLGQPAQTRPPPAVFRQFGRGGHPFFPPSSQAV